MRSKSKHENLASLVPGNSLVSAIPKIIIFVNNIVKMYNTL